MNTAPGVKGFVTLPWPERFWSKVDKRGPDECWPWLGSRKNGAGRDYGNAWVGGTNRPAHVVAWELVNGKPFPEGMDGCHTCDNPPCCNPAHIFPGTPKDNALDAASKGRVRNQNSGKEVCNNGHPLSGANLILQAGNRRRCRECLNATVRAYQSTEAFKAARRVRRRARRAEAQA